jgi:hypothetical protein
MSKRQMEVLVDDIDGTPIMDESQGRSIPVKIGDVETTLDLTNENIARLEQTFREFISAGEGNVATSNSTPTRRTTQSSEDLSVIRDWARKNGHKVNDRGRIPFSVMDAFTKAHMGKLR